MNGYRHELTGQVVIMTAAEDGPYIEFCDNIRKCLAPESHLETSVAQAIADDRWRLQRAASIENSLFAMGQSVERPAEHPQIQIATKQAVTFMREAKTVNYLSLYENRTLSRIDRQMAALKQLQDERKAALAQAVEEADLLA